MEYAELLEEVRLKAYKQRESKSSRNWTTQPKPL